MNDKLLDKIGLITGGSSGIGLATARRFVEAGAHVFITGRRQSELDRAVADLGPTASAIQGDVSVLAGIRQLGDGNNGCSG